MKEKNCEASLGIICKVSSVYADKQKLKNFIHLYHVWINLPDILLYSELARSKNFILENMRTTSSASSSSLPRQSVAKARQDFSDGFAENLSAYKKTCPLEYFTFLPTFKSYVAWRTNSRYSLIISLFNSFLNSYQRDKVYFYYGNLFVWHLKIKKINICCNSAVILVLLTFLLGLLQVLGPKSFG